MTRNITLRMDEAMIKTCRHLAVEENKSFSQWVIDTLKRAITRKDTYANVGKRAIQRLENGLHLGGAPLKRNDIYER